MNNEELCERIVKEMFPFENERDENFDAYNGFVPFMRDTVKKALTSGILIPAEKMLTKADFEKVIKKWRSPQGGSFTPAFCEYAAKELHQSSRQKAGIK